MFIVNGYAEKDDGNFLNPFQVTQLVGSGLFVGPYPSDDFDITILKNKGVSAVLNLQTKDDFERHQIDWKRTLKIFYHNGIVLAKNFPVNDLHEEIYSSDIIQAAQYLNDMINNKNLNVYIYCSSGISRAPTVILAYLTLFKKAQCWQYIPLVESLIISHYPCCSPNVKIVQGLVEQNLEF